MKPRACLDLTPLSTGSRFRGIGTYALALGRALAATPTEDLDLCALIGRGVTTRVVPLAAGVEQAMDASAGPAVPYATHYALSHTTGAARLVAGRVALLHATDPKGAPCLPGMRTLTTCHDLIPTVLGPPYRPPWLPEPVVALVDRVRYCLPDHVIAISEHTRDDVTRATGVSPARVSVIHHGVDHALFQPRVADGEAALVRELVGARPFFLYVGGFDARKQVPSLVRAFGRRVGELDEALVIVGQMKPAWEGAIREAIAASGAGDRVLLPGFVDAAHLPALYRAATAHAMVSTYEGFGMTVLEAFAAGCPVVAARASCVPEVAGDAALLVPPVDDDALGDALVRLSRDPALREGLRQRGLRRAATFTWERCARQTLAVYRRVLGFPPDGG